MNARGFTVAAALALAAGCGGDKQESKPLPPAISLGAPEGGGHPESAHEGMPVPAPAPVPAPSTRFRAPEGWQTETPTSTMRVAQFRIPRADGDAIDGDAAVFGKIGGTTKANIDRWRGQFTEVAQGKDEVKEITEGVKSKIVLLDITGNYSGDMGGGMGAAHGGGEPGTMRMLGAVVEDPEGSFYIKVKGPPATIAKWETSILEFIKSTAK